mgnify:CR=1 FL=1
MMDDLPAAAHTGTFQANALACAAAVATLNTVEHAVFHEHVAELRKTLLTEISDLAESHNWTISGSGLMIGISMNPDGSHSGVGSKIQASLFQQGFFALESADHLRLSPPACLEPKDIKRFGTSLQNAAEGPN